MKFLGLDLKTISFSLVFALLIVSTVQYYNWNQKNLEPIENWISINQLSIPPIIKKGIIPTVVFDIDVKQKIKSDLYIELQRIDKSETKTICFNIIKNNQYGITQKQGINYSLDILLGKKCNLTPGTYRIYCKWLADRGIAYYKVWLDKTSNIFEITE